MKLEIPQSYLIIDMNIEASAKFEVGNMIDNVYAQSIEKL